MASTTEENNPAASNTFDEIPPLTTTILTDDMDKTAALKLIADSIAQQRQTASRAIIFHPLTIAVYVVVIGMVCQYMINSRSDIALAFTTSAGITMALLVAVRGLTSGYIKLAEAMNFKFATNEHGEEDIFIGARYGEGIIGALLLRLERNGHGPKGKRKSGKLGGKGVVRAWTTRLRYRGKGVGTEMLEEAVKITRDVLGNSAELGFASEHANSNMVLPAIFNGSFKMREARAAKTLEEVVSSMEAGAKNTR